MGKNWLIRTKSNHILGPVSKEKVLELYQNGSIKLDDEICSGNGYWFFIRESELVDKYLKGSSIQSFNPISEAKDVLTSANPEAEETPGRDDITRVGGIDLKNFKEEAAIPATPKVEKAIEPPLEIPQKKKLKSESQVKQSDTPKKQARQNWFKYVGLLIFVILFLMIYYRKSILKTFFSSEAYYPLKTLIIAEAHAQDESPEKKKSS